MSPHVQYALPEDDKGSSPLQLESQQPLIPKWHRVQDAVCGTQGVLAWACTSTALLVVVSITLVSFKLPGFNLLQPYNQHLPQQGRHSAGYGHKTSQNAPYVQLLVCTGWWRGI